MGAARGAQLSNARKGLVNQTSKAVESGVVRCMYSTCVKKTAHTPTLLTLLFAYCTQW